jgi:hypothetical protein
MAITLSADAKNAVNDALVDLVDVGTTNTEGKMIIKDGGAVTLVEIPFNDPAFGDSALGVATLSGTPLSDTAVATGTAVTFDVVDKDENVIYSGTVTIAGGGGDAIIDSTSITIGDTVQLNSHTITAP